MKKFLLTLGCLVIIVLMLAGEISFPVSFFFNIDFLVILAVLLLLFFFVRFYSNCVGPLKEIQVQFSEALRLIQKEEDELLVLKKLKDFFGEDLVCSQCLREFEKTLFPVSGTNESGEIEVVQFKLIESSSLFFDAGIVIDGQAKTTFYNHLPGIFTSIGIIGTFLGLIFGLHAFSANTMDVESMQNSVRGLLDSVTQAFIVSATAIICAVFATWLEKTNYQIALSKLNSFVSCLDSKFSGGVSNEFMLELLELTRQNTTQSKQIMDGFVVDLKQLLEENNELQREMISKAISDTFSGSFDGIAKAVENMNKVTAELQRYITASKKEAGAATGKIAGDICSTIEVVRDEIQGFKDVVEGATGKLLQVGDLLENVISGCNGTLKQMGESSKEQAEVFRDAIEKSTEGLVQSINGVNEALKDTFNLLMVCQKQTSVIAKHVEETALSLEQTTAQSQKMTVDFSLAQDQVQHNLGELKEVVGNFKDSIGQSDDVILKIYDIVEKIHASNEETSAYAEDAAKKLKRVFEEFQAGTENVGVKVNANLDTLMTTACRKLESSIDELNALLGDFTDELTEIRQTAENRSTTGERNHV